MKRQFFDKRSDLNNKECSLFFKLEDILRLFWIKGVVRWFKRVVILADWRKISMDYKKWFHRNMPEGVLSWYEIILNGDKRILFLRSDVSWDVYYDMEKYGINLWSYYRVFTEDDIKKLPDFKKEEFWRIFYEISRLELAIIKESGKKLVEVLV